MRYHYKRITYQPVIIAGIVTLIGRLRCESGEGLNIPEGNRTEAQVIAWAFVFTEETMASKSNPRQANGNLRRKHRARLKAMGMPCGICKGRLGPIHYDEPSDAAHPLSFVIDEIKPVSKWKLFGYDSPQAAAQDWDNLQPAHWICNQAKSNKTDLDGSDRVRVRSRINIIDGDW